MNRTKLIAAALALTVAPAIALAQATPVGLWKTIDDKTKSERSLLRITESGGVFTAKVEKLLAPDAKQVCDKCSDDRKDKPIVGMEVVRGLKAGSEAGVFEGGTILDAAEGKIYKVRMQPIEGGAKMEVRGFIGMPLLGRTQTWIRVE